MTNFHQQGLSRDRLLIDTLRKWGVMDIDQIVLAVPFPSKRVAQRRLNKLLTLKMIKRSTATLPYFYYLEYCNDMLERVNKNWLRLWVMRNLHSWDKLEYWDYQTYRIRNTVQNTVKEYSFTDTPMKFLDDMVIVLDDAIIDKIKEELKSCVK